VSDPLMTLHWLPADRPARLGLAVSRKVDPNAVGRNRIKRVLRDILRQTRTDIQPGDFVVVARSAARSASNDEIRQAFLRLLRRLRALPTPGVDGTMPPPDGIATLTPPHPLLGPTRHRPPAPPSLSADEPDPRIPHFCLADGGRAAVDGVEP